MKSNVLAGTLAKLDSLVDMSTVTVEIYRKSRHLPSRYRRISLQQVSSVFRKSIAALVETLKMFSLVIVAVLPFAVIVGTIVLAVVLVLHAGRSGKGKR
jgi:uncharacterized membrane protein